MNSCLYKRKFKLTKVQHLSGSYTKRMNYCSGNIHYSESPDKIDIYAFAGATRTDRQCILSVT